MKANFHHKKEEGLSVTFDGEWNILSAFLESELVDYAEKHIALKKKGRWMGDIICIQLLERDMYKVYSGLMDDVPSLIIARKKILLLIDEWASFKLKKKDKVVNV